MALCLDMDCDVLMEFYVIRLISDFPRCIFSFYSPVILSI